MADVRIVSRNNNIVVVDGEVFHLDRILAFVQKVNSSEAPSYLDSARIVDELWGLYTILKHIPDDKIQRFYIHEPRFDQEMWKE